MKLNDLGKKYLELENGTGNFNIKVGGETINTVAGSDRANKFVESLKRKGITAIAEADEPTTDKSARARLDLNLRDRGHSVEKPKKGKGSYARSDKHKKPVSEGPLVVSRSSDLMGMLDVLLKDFKSKSPSDEEMIALVKSLGYNMTKDGERTTLVKEEDCDIDEGNGNIRKGLASVALIAGLWSVNDHVAQKAYDASPQLQKLTAYLEVAKDHNDQRMIDQLEQRIGNHKTRIDIGKGEVMGNDGRPVDVKYDKEAN